MTDRMSRLTDNLYKETGKVCNVMRDKLSGALTDKFYQAKTD